MEIPFSTLGKTQTFRFGRSERFSKGDRPLGRELMSVPSTSSARSCSFGVGERSSLINKHKIAIPAPNAYQLTPEPRSGYSVQGKPQSNFSFERVSQLPGPGSYNPCLTMDRRKFTLKNRTPIKFRSFSPGPAAYCPNYNVVLNKPSGGFIPKSRLCKPIHEKKKEASPGPGNYKIASCFRENALKYPIIEYKKK